MANENRYAVQRPIKRRRIRWLRRLLFGSIALISLALGISAGILFFSSPTIRETVHVVLNRGLDPERAFPGRTEMNILLMGRDVDIDRKHNVLKTNGRTDTMILAHVSFAEKQVNLLSIPRDTKVRIPGHRGTHKINAAHAFGGPQLACETVENLLAVRPDEFVVVDYDAFIKAIDELGGIEVNVDKELNYDDNWGGLHIHLKPGLQRLDGYQAMGFVRYRRSNDGRADSDEQRIARQQRFLAALKKRIMIPGNFTKLPGIADSLSAHMKSTLTLDQLISLAFFARNLPAENIKMATLPADDGRVFVTAREEETRELVQRMFY